MSSKGLVNVKIDDKNKTCAILAAKRRRTMGVNKASLAAQCEARLTQMYTIYKFQPSIKQQPDKINIKKPMMVYMV